MSVISAADARGGHAFSTDAPTAASTAAVDAAEPVDRFIALLTGSLSQRSFVKLVLTKYHGEPADLRRLDVRPIQLRGAPSLSFTFHHATRDVTRNHPAVADGAGNALAELRGWLGTTGAGFRQAHLQTAAQHVELMISKRGRATLRISVAGSAAPAAAAAAPAGPAERVDPAASAAAAGDAAARGVLPADATTDGAAAAQPHDRVRHRHVPLSRPFLAALGVTSGMTAGVSPDGNAAGNPRLVPAMARKYRQIDKFVEIFAAAFSASPLGAGKPPDPPVTPLRVVDFGAGKGYLTFAVHDHLRHVLGRDAEVVGVELRRDLVDAGNATAARLGLHGLRFEQGDLRQHSRQPAAGAAAPPIDVVIALHACDVATDHAIHLGIRAGAAVVMCSPCCHQQLRPQLRKPQPLRAAAARRPPRQEAEMVTDTLRALLLEACGYATQVFEFVSLEHTNKNKMILGVRRTSSTLLPPPADVLTQIDDIQRFYGIREQCLQTLLRADGVLPAVPTAPIAP